MKSVGASISTAGRFDRRDLGNLFLLSLLSATLYFWQLGSLPFYERGEGREGLVVWEMVHSGNWILPRVNGEYIPFKPPLFHWIGALAATLSGHLDEFVIRLPSALFATLGVLLTYWAARRWWDRRAGLSAGLVLVTCFGWWQAATIAQVDMVLSFFVTAALLLFYSLYRAERNRHWKAIALAALLALATLAKGPLGTAAPAVIIVLFLLLQRDLALVFRLPLFAGLVVYLAIAGSWYALAYAQGGWSFVQRQIIEETLLTGVGDYGRYQPIYYYLPVVFYDLTPWSFFAPALVVFLYLRRTRLSSEGLLFPLVWFVGILLLYSLARGKRGIYMVPLYPAVALLFGAWWSHLASGKEDSAKTARWLGWLYVISCAALVLGIGLYGLGDPASLGQRFQSLTRKLQALGLLQADGQGFVAAVKYSIPLLSALILLLAWSLWRRFWTFALAAIAAVALVQLLLVRAVYLPQFAAPRTFKPFIAGVMQTVGPSTPMAFYRAFDGAAIFYANRHIPPYESLDAPLPWPYYLLMWEEDFKRIAAANDLAAVAISTGKGPALHHRLVLVKSPHKAPLIDGATNPPPNEDRSSP